MNFPNIKGVLNASDKLILALDTNDSQEALAWVDRFQGRIGTFKIGLELFSAHGPDLVREVRKRKAEVFLDLKLHDIPNTVSRAVECAAQLEVRFLTLHALGGRGMLSAAADAVSSHPETTLLAVTVLTHLSDDDLNEMGFDHTASGEATQLARMAQKSGIHGLVCSALEAPYMRQFLPHDFKLITPGIRPLGSDSQDQARIATPSEALKNGSDFLVIGRPILAVPDPDAALDSILAECETALQESRA
jgi:orotidine-5'-phosphate decarboxylase